MTRLIDADILMSHINKADKPRISVIAVKGCINNAPTIEAIPVEWIKTEAEKIKETAPLTSYAMSEILRIWKENL